MSARQQQRKASPPRPTLLVGDLDACHCTYDDLKARVDSALSAPSSTPGVWQDMVPRFRALRESIVHLDVKGPFSLQAYELAADVCCRARDWGEFLKCIQQLLYTIYPRNYPAAYEDVEHAPTPDPGRDTGHPRPCSLGASEGGGVWRPLCQEALGRLPEFTGAHILYFTCIVPKPEAFELSTLLRKTPPGIARLPSVKSALSASACLVRGDHGSFLRLWSETSSPIAQQLMAEAVEASRREMMQALAASYRLLPVTAVLRMLHLAEGDQAALLAVIKGAADRGSRGSSQALEALRSSAFACESSGSCPAVVSLTFKT